MLSWQPVFADKRVRDVAVDAWRKEERNDVGDIVESGASSVRDCKWQHRDSILRCERPYEEMNRLVTFVYHHMGSLKRGGDDNVIYDGVYVLARTDAEVMRMCESAMNNYNTVHLYFDHLLMPTLKLLTTMFVYEINPPVDDVHEDKVTNKNEVVTEATVEVNELNKGVSGVVNEIMNEVVNEATVEVNELDKGVSGLMNEEVHEVNGDKDTKVALAPEKGVKKVRKRHPRPPPSGLSQDRRVGENGQAQGDAGQAETVNEATHESNADEANDPNEGSDFGHPIVDDLMVEEVNTENTTGKPFVTVYLNPPGSDDEEEPVFPQHNPNTPYEKITLELNMKFKTMDHFKTAVQKNEKKRCRVICYDPDCPWLCYYGRTTYPASF
ncbi:hypothetical protein Ahy_B08g091991 [Arachis hypogaea]|uniref:Transposase MuDR plant domain-containing protein n=1 Tax=Arachis hypogaea TaxID=3818 RepID=A0A444Y316_ARAHY|nr:hypothetical protein Ahy_B08g091991 [Arachis hypogaea]